jgi:hypothetical protein
MLPWFFRDPARFDTERRELEALLAAASWLVGYEWVLTDGLSVDAIIRAHGYDYEVRVSFPLLYPDAPSVVRPLKQQQRLSQHQYGDADGPLCLQWGPDNWHRQITAAQMLESAYQLFHAENPLGQDRPAVPRVAPSRHQLTLGQEVRGQWIRWYVSDRLRSFVDTLTRPSEGSFRFSFRKLGDSWCVLVHEASAFGGEIWKDARIPTALPGAAHYSGAWAKTSLDATVIRGVTNLDGLSRLLTGHVSPELLAIDGTSPVQGFQNGIRGVLIYDREDRSHLFVVFSDGSVWYCTPVCSDTADMQRRAPTSTELAEKRIGIVGLGSAGSKIAITLARMGGKKFFFADHDVLLPENLHRHALDWQGVTQHKVDAIALAMSYIEPTIDVDTSRIHVVGQESNAAVNGVLARLSECDVLVDATANARVFTLLAAVARAAEKPFVWLEVFGGGVGGFIARSRPGVDPSALHMRALYLGYCQENPPPASLVSAVDYAREESSGGVLAASDADVAVIAHHAARLVHDCLLAADRAVFPHSMYLIGLLKAWVFEAPFATIPISTEGVPVTETEGMASDMTPDTIAFLRDLLDKTSE